MRRNSWLLLLLSPLFLTLAVGLGYSVISISGLPVSSPEASVEALTELSTKPSTDLQTMVLDRLAESGVSNPVTAVLLNFRGYDTLLEMVVLLLALLAVWSLSASSPDASSQEIRSQEIKTQKIKTKESKPLTGRLIANESTTEQTSRPVQNTLTGLLLPVFILVAAYLLWVGAHAPGGAFQAGSVLGAAGVLLLLTGRSLRARLAALPLRLVLVAGPGAFVVMALLSLLFEGQLLSYPPAQAGLLILILETAATLSIGVTLAALFAGSYPGDYFRDYSGNTPEDNSGDKPENKPEEQTENRPEKLPHNRQNR